MNFKKKVSGSWTDTPHYIHNTSTDTITTLPAVIHPTGTTATVGLKGNTLQSSIPSPTSPVTPQGTGERTGNLFDESNFALVQVTSTAYRYGTSLGVLPQGVYTFNATKSAGAQSIYLTAKLNGVYSQTTISSVPFSFTADGDSEYIIRTVNNTGTTWEAEKYSDMMLNTGSTPLQYEKYGYKIPISSANTTTPVYLGEVETTRKVKKLVLTGEENITQHSVQNDIVGVRIPTPSSVLGASIVICSHYEGVLWPVYNGYRRYGIVASNPSSGNAIVYMSAPDSEHNTLSTFVQWIKDQYAAGTPVTVWYVLATEETAVVNEPLMKIGDYADEVSGITIPTIAGANTIDIDTTLKPSEVTATYKGWHPVQSVHERDNGQWD